MSAGTVTGRVLMTPKIYIGGYDVTGYHDKISAPITKEMLTPQQFGATGKQRKAGLWDLIMAHSGFWDGGADTIDAVLRGLPASNVLTLCPNTGAMGDKSAWFCNIITPKYETGGKVGGMITFAGSAALQDGSPVLNGTVLQASTITASGTGTAYNLGAAAVTQHLYAALHVTATSGNANRTLDVIVESADDGGGTGAQTRMTFTQVTTDVGAEFLTPVAGDAGISQEFWRAKYTRGGTDGSFTFIITFAFL